MHFNLWASIQRRLYRIRREFRRLWKNYFYQSFLATVVVFIVLLLLNLEHARGNRRFNQQHRAVSGTSVLQEVLERPDVEKSFC